MRSLIRATQALSLGNASSRCSFTARASVSATAKRHITSSAAKCADSQFQPSSGPSSSSPSFSASSSPSGAPAPAPQSAADKSKGQWDAVLDTFSPDIRGNYLGSAPKLDEREAQEDAWMTQRVYGNTRLASPTTIGRTVTGQEDISVAMNMLKGILNRNSVRQQVFAGMRYEKPSKKRRRLRSLRHRRRFKDLVRKKVQLAMQIKATGA
ncbi:hypothetical protein IE81DRAFT_345048 [Ceraceosorus guamensis]|uniref:Ribosomal protein S21 n=1 Tax=Ceraceosorus guamensis TaxID=1522189 RepID=A0A316W586_9BASI|nr:hypothetical protein IE81DRAFT_345048 [Ceraceosorus guamensis]PWN44979.1 hypothetical protein IE81DRAFT_345048 [Ceraceosorus guamensis]